MKETHRGIPTITNKKNEKKSKTITNRFNQLSLSLPRIDNKKRWAGYAGLTGISRKLAKIIPKSKIYIEPFAGTAKVYQELVKIKPRKFNFAVLNDKSEFIIVWLKTNFPDAIVTHNDFTDTIKTWDNQHNFTLFDQPWGKGSYDQKYSCFDRTSTIEYDKEVIRLCSDLKGKFIITTRRENKVMLESGFNNYLIQSEYVVSGRYPLVMLTSNLSIQGLQKARIDTIE